MNENDPRYPRNGNLLVVRSVFCCFFYGQKSSPRAIEISSTCFCKQRPHTLWFNSPRRPSWGVATTTLVPPNLLQLTTQQQFHLFCESYCRIPQAILQDEVLYWYALNAMSCFHFVWLESGALHCGNVVCDDALRVSITNSVAPISKLPRNPKIACSSACIEW